MVKWLATFKIKPTCDMVKVFTGEITLGDYTLRFKEEDNMFIGEIVKELNIKNAIEARKILAECIERELIPSLILYTGCGLIFNPNDMQLQYEGPRTKGIVVSNVVSICAFSLIVMNSESFKRKIKFYTNKIECLDKFRREWFLRALRFWNKGAMDSDPIDKFVNFYIALEIFTKRVLGYSDLNKHVLEKIKIGYNVKFSYVIDNREWDVCEIRNHLIHGGACSMKEIKKLDIAIEIAMKIVDRFGKDFLELIRNFLT